VEPGAEKAAWFKSMDIEVGSDKCFLGQFQRIRFVVNMAENEKKNPLLMPVHESVQGSIFPGLQSLDEEQVWIIFRHVQLYLEVLSS
jgi:isocitrate dehydrogenase kinase/phosphatase